MMKQLIPAVNNNDHVLGNPDAPIELVEYGDYECPYCGLAYPVVHEILKELGNGIRFVFRNFPLSNIHPNAFATAVATEAADLQGRFWEMHDIVFEHQKWLDPDDMLLLAGKIGLDPDRFKTDIHNPDLIEKVEKDFESGIRSGVNRTPSFFINGEKYEGDWQNGNLLNYLKSILQAASETSE